MTAVIGILLASFNLRAGVTGWAPLVDEVAAEIPLSTTAVGFLGMIPPLAFGVAGLTSSWVTSRLPLNLTLTAAIILIASGHVLQATAMNLATFMAGSIVGVLGAGFANVLLPGAVKHYAPRAIGRVTAAYVTTLALATSLPALLAVPVAQSLRWRASFGMWAIIAAIAIVPWVVLLLSERVRRTQVASGHLLREPMPARRGLGFRSLVRSKTLRGMTIVFIASSVPLYAIFALLPLMLKDLAGTPAHVSGALMALFAILSLPQAMFIPMITTRLRSPTMLVVISVTVFCTGVAGLLIAPGGGLLTLWIIALGAGQFLFPMTLTLVSLRTLTSATATRVSGFVQGVSYSIAGLGPLLFAALRELTGSWTPVLICVIATSLLALSAIPSLRRRGIVELEIEEAERAQAD